MTENQSTQAAINDFLSQRTLAVVGVSRSGKKFGNAVVKELAAKGYTVLPVNPNAHEIEGTRCYASLRDLPTKVDGIVTVVPPAETARVVREAHQAGVPRVWMQQGSDSAEAISFCRQSGMQEVHGECILMFAPDALFFHRAHRFVRGLFGKNPR